MLSEALNGVFVNNKWTVSDAREMDDSGGVLDLPPNINCFLRLATRVNLSLRAKMD